MKIRSVTDEEIEEDTHRLEYLTLIDTLILCQLSQIVDDSYTNAHDRDVLIMSTLTNRGQKCTIPAETKRS